MQPPPMPQGPSPYWAPPRQRSPASLVGAVLLVVLISMFVVGMILVAGSPFGFSGFAPFCGVIAFMIIVFIIIAVSAATGAFQRRYLPPPPPIQQPMVPAGIQGPVALNCPNCGAPPGNVDRFGVATCTYCGTRFLVR